MCTEGENFFCHNDKGIILEFETDEGLDLEWLSDQIEYLYNSVPTTSLLAIREKQLHDFADFNLLIKTAS